MGKAKEITVDAAMCEHAEAFADAVEALAVFASLEGQVNPEAFTELDPEAFTEFARAVPAETLKHFGPIKALMDEISRRRPTTDFDTLTDLFLSGEMVIGKPCRTRKEARETAEVLLLMVEEGYMRETTKPGGLVTFERTDKPEFLS